ncbi:MULTISPECIES: LysR family transcriptional regulator [unclassified Comamonas]|uniref:LysR family transcriptional regulator n=1 Tax=Comamonas squillarum TaxID=2977320 RepID=A0ABY6A2V8_9BURK|nr:MULTISPECIES: LysR family transcriptional regulator [unclassified Comamonas]PWB18827.1 LysR family transcriptional regulator [Comamonas sp. JNW]UXC19355.1 LysR family transcriptional regulator [Comamonas sp. PR12]
MAALNLRQIEVFRAVMSTGSIAGASQILFVSQPAVSRLLAYTEQRIGFVLFERIKGRLFATPEARRLIGEVEQVYQSVQRVNDLAGDLARHRTGILNLVSGPSIGQSFIPQAVASFRQQFPDCKMTFACHGHEQIRERLLNHQADLGVISSAIEHPNLDITPLCTNRLVCIMPANHALCEKEEVTPEDLMQWPMVGYGHDTPMGRRVTAYCQDMELEPNEVVEVGSPQNAGSMVEMGVGIALVDEFSVRSWHASRPVMVRPLRNAPVLQTNLVHHKFEPMSQLAQRFIAELRQLVEQYGFVLARERDMEPAVTP